MKIKKLLNTQKREILFSKIVKHAKWHLKKSNGPALPVFILGAQRSGTTMLMNVMHLSAQTKVYDESRRNKLFNEFRLKSFKALNAAIDGSKADFVFLKPLADSHLAGKYIERLPKAKFIWMYRHYLDVAYSAVHKWKTADAAIRKVCRGMSGGGWFQEGLSEDAAAILKQHYHDGLSTFELRCLVWWARNRLYFENTLSRYPNVMLLKYEDIAQAPLASLKTIGEFTGLTVNTRMYRFIHSRSIGNKSYPPLNKKIASLCEQQLSRLDLAHKSERRSFQSKGGQTAPALRGETTMPGRHAEANRASFSGL